MGGWAGGVALNVRQRETHVTGRKASLLHFCAHDSMIISLLVLFCMLSINKSSFSIPATSLCTFSNPPLQKKYLEGHLEPSERQGLLDSLNSTNQEPSNVTQSKLPLIRMMLRGLKFHKIPSSPVQHAKHQQLQCSGCRMATLHSLGPASTSQLVGNKRMLPSRREVLRTHRPCLH